MSKPRRQRWWETARYLGLVMTVAIFVVPSLQAQGQATLIFDQQSATGPISIAGNGGTDGFDIQPFPLTQSFVPTLSAIGFVQLEFWDIPSNGSNGVTVAVNLWVGSPNINSATLLGSTIPVFMPDGFQQVGLGGAGVTNFFFSSPMVLTPGQTYYLQPVALSGDNPWDIIVLNDTYSNGQLFQRGNAIQPSADLWFREGVVPEPSTLAFFGVGGLLFLARKRFRNSLFVALLFLVW